MIVQEILEDNPTLIKTYSDAGYLIRQDETGILYPEAIDPIDMHRTYTETDEPIDIPDEEVPEDE